MRFIERRNTQWLVFALSWSSVALLAIALGRYATPAFHGAPGGGRLVPRVPPPPADFAMLLYQLGVGSVDWYLAAVALPCLLMSARRLDAERRRVARTVAIMLGAAGALVAVASVIDYTWTYRGVPIRPPLAAYIPMTLRQHVLTWIAVIGIVATIEGRRRAIRAAIERERLQAEVAKQRLIALTGQLRPHFLFNTLQAISTLIHRDPEAADDMLTKLSDLLADVLRHRDSPFVPLGDEVRYARTWLEIAQIRFGGRLEFEIDVPEDLHEFSVPLFIIQPLLENALSHGIGGVMRGGCVTLRARRTERRLHLAVIDNGTGLPPASQRREGIGLANTRERLATAFGSDQHLALTSEPSVGTIVNIDMPATTVSAAPSLPS